MKNSLQEIRNAASERTLPRGTGFQPVSSGALLQRTRLSDGHCQTRVENPCHWGIARGIIAACLVLSPLAIAADKAPPEVFPPQKMPPVLSPQEELKTFQLQPGYRMELVVSDPQIAEPVQCVFDGNGRMYIAEMRSYMQNIDGKDELTPSGRVSCFESSKGDGVFDKHTVFADQLILPRMILPLDKGQLLIGQTNTNDIDLFHDTKYAGVSDGKASFFQGGPRPGNLEHQPSGLLWSMDNWIYTTYNAYRLRWTPKGETLKEPTESNGGQWGVAQDDFGKLWWSNAGAERGLWHFQTHVLYGAIDVPDQFDPIFMEVYPAMATPDVQGGHSRLRVPERTLNHFTACGGQEVYRGDRLPEDLRGDALLPEPVGRLIRRAKVTVEDGVTQLKNPYQAEKSEFIRSTDPYFRPINVTTAPDGCLYIVDMYRGIIQEGAWVNEGSYLRKVVQQYGYQSVVSHGRIWRLVHEKFQPGPQPHLLDETPAQLVANLENPNGWWRDTAQKLLILRQESSVVPALKSMALSSQNVFARIQALWTLEGLEAIDPATIGAELKDASPQIRAAAIRVSETLFKKGDDSLHAQVSALAKDSDPGVVLQVIETSKVLKWPDWKSNAMLTVMNNGSHGVQEIGKQLLYVPKTFNSKEFSGAQLKLLNKGQEVYSELCFACHGYDGTGMPMGGAPPGTMMAPPLAGSHTVQGPSAGMISVLLHGLSGPVNGKTYTAQMVTMGQNDDEWIASVASYVRSSFGNNAPPVNPAAVKKLREAQKDRKDPWTLQEIAETVTPKSLLEKGELKVTASLHPEDAKKAIDDDAETRYSTGMKQEPGQWFQIELPRPTTITGVRLDAGASKNDYPRGYSLQVSDDGKAWGKPLVEGKGTSAVTEIVLPSPTKTKFIRITQTGTNGGFWSIHELEVLTGTSVAGR